MENGIKNLKKRFFGILTLLLILGSAYFVTA